MACWFDPMGCLSTSASFAESEVQSLWMTHLFHLGDKKRERLPAGIRHSSHKWAPSCCPCECLAWKESLYMGIYMDYWLIAFVSFVSFVSGHFASTPFLEHL